jgi:hypothetical protein
LEVDSNGEVRSPRALPSPPIVEVPPPAAPATPVVPTPTTAGGEPDDSRDDTEDLVMRPKMTMKEKMKVLMSEGDPFCLMHSSKTAPGYFPWLLRNTPLELGNTVYPMYVTHSWTEPPLGTYYMTRVHIRVRNHTGGGYISRTTHESATPHSTNRASVSNTARRALFSLRSRHD